MRVASGLAAGCSRLTLRLVICRRWPGSDAPYGAQVDTAATVWCRDVTFVTAGRCEMTDIRLGADKGCPDERKAKLTARQFLMAKLASLVAWLSLTCMALPAAAADQPELDRARAVARLIAQSVWGVVPEAPQHKREIRPELIRGSAVAVSATTLLAHCTSLSGSDRVGLVRHNKFRVAGSVAADPHGDVCMLTVADAPLKVANWYRSPADIDVGEPVFAIVNRTAADISLVEGRVTALAGAEAHLQTSLVLPAGVLSAIVFDRDANLLGLGAPSIDGTTSVAPITAALAPLLELRHQQATGVSAPERKFAPSNDFQRDAVAEPIAMPPAATAALRLDLVARQGPRPVLNVDERLQAQLRTTGDAYVYCFYQDDDGQVSRVFPNRFQPDALVRADRTVAVPGDGAGFELVANRAGANEELRCFAAAHDPGPSLPADLVSTDLEPLPVNALTEVAAAFRHVDAAVAEAELLIEVLPETRLAVALGVPRGALVTR